MSLLRTLADTTRRTELTTRTGVIQQLSGLMIEATGPDAVLGEVCRIDVRGRAGQTVAPLMAEVVGMRGGRVMLMPYGSSEGLARGWNPTLHQRKPSSREIPPSSSK